jgi:tetratricopeptide (TPR) repeat protein
VVGLWRVSRPLSICILLPLLTLGSARAMAQPDAGSADQPPPADNENQEPRGGQEQPAEGEPADEDQAEPPTGGPEAEPAGPPARPLLDKLAAAQTAAERTQAVEALLALDPMPVAELSKFLSRTRSSNEADRRKLLADRGFDVPDEKGRFRAPGRQADKEERANDKLDWLAPLLELPASPALSDVVLDIAAVRALAASKQSAGAAAILAFAFRDDGMAYRDECGRYLRRMSPWSLPALIHSAQSPSVRNKSRARYARYQLERLDRENPRKALSDAPTDELQAEILHTFADSQYREAVFAVLDNVDHVSPRVRKAARDAWKEYTTGRAPPEPPKQKLLLPGGKQTEEEMPLWLDHRELADVAIRRRLEELTGKKPPARAKLIELTEQLYAVYDSGRAARLDKELAAGLAEVSEGRVADATRRFDAVLVQAPDYARRGEMAGAYMKLGEELEKASKWREAATAFGKAHAVAPAGPTADQALARHHRARGRVLAAEGKKEVAAAEMKRATEIDRAVDRQKQEVQEAGRGDREWMLVVGICGGLAGLALLGMGLAWRRRAAWRAWRG